MCKVMLGKMLAFMSLTTKQGIPHSLLLIQGGRSHTADPIKGPPNWKKPVVPLAVLQLCCGCQSSCRQLVRKLAFTEYLLHAE